MCVGWCVAERGRCKSASGGEMAVGGVRIDHSWGSITVRAGEPASSGWTSEGSSVSPNGPPAALGTYGALGAGPLQTFSAFSSPLGTTGQVVGDLRDTNQDGDGDGRVIGLVDAIDIATCRANSKPSASHEQANCSLCRARLLPTLSGVSRAVAIGPRIHVRSGRGVSSR